MDTQLLLVVLVVLGLAALASVSALVYASYVRSTVRPVKNGAKVAQGWRRILAAQGKSGAMTVRILSVSDRAMDGNKAWIEHTGSGDREEAFFALQHVFEGDVMVLRGCKKGEGPEDADPDVLYVHPKHVLAHGVDPANIPHANSPARYKRRPFIS